MREDSEMRGGMNIQHSFLLYLTSFASTMIRYESASQSKEFTSWTACFLTVLHEISFERLQFNFPFHDCGPSSYDENHEIPIR